MNDLMSEMAYIVKCHACMKNYFNDFTVHVKK